jgi:hypothetical protein
MEWSDGIDCLNIAMEWRIDEYNCFIEGSDGIECLNGAMEWRID